MRSIFHFATSASKSVPSWNFTPSSRWKTYVFPPSRTSQDVASSGTILSSGGGVSFNRELYMLFMSQPAGAPWAGPWLASKKAGSPGQAMRRVPPYLGGSAPPRRVASPSTTSRLHHTSQRVFIWTSCVRQHCTMHDELAAQPRRDPHHATIRPH